MADNSGQSNLIAGCLPGWFSPLRPDLLTKRPYFLVPFGLAEQTDALEPIKEEVSAAIQATNATDLFVMSHGWHRNLFAGILAYDKLIGRFVALKARGRLDSDGAVRPVFVAVHWNSDPEVDGWIDRSGRRDKQSFLDNAAKLFVPNLTHLPEATNTQKTFSAKMRAISPTGAKNAADHEIGLEDVAQAIFVDDMEDIFEAMSEVSAPDSPSSPVDVNLWTDFTDRMKRYELRGFEAPATPEEKAAAVWRCYFEAQSKTFLVDQQAKPQAVGWFGSALGVLLKFVIGIAGITAFIGGLPKIAEGLMNIPWAGIWEELSQPSKWIHGFISPAYDGPTWTILGCIAAGCLIVFGILVLIGKPIRGFPIQTVVWAPVQLVATLPALIYLLATYLFRSWVAVVGIVALFLGWYAAGVGILLACILGTLVASVFDFRLNGVFREKLKSPEDHAVQIREILVAPAKATVRGLIRIVGQDSAVYRTAMVLQNQLAFFQMQKEGTNAGCEVGSWLYELSNSLPESNQKVKVHFVGHSFGGLVIANALRTWAQKVASKPDPANQAQAPSPPAAPKRFVMASAQPQTPLPVQGSPLEVHTFCMIQGAIASDWFRYEGPAMSMVKGSIACIFSGYDTANGFLYPLANNGRIAAGYVGFCNLGAKDVPREISKSGFRQALRIGQGGDFSLLVKPPIIDVEISKAESATPHPPEAKTALSPIPLLLNLDASRIIYEGPVAVGGGHDDIFKDDVVNLMWAVCTYK